MSQRTSSADVKTTGDPRLPKRFAVRGIVFGLVLGAGMATLTMCRSRAHDSKVAPVSGPGPGGGVMAVSATLGLAHFKPRPLESYASQSLTSAFRAALISVTLSISNVATLGGCQIGRASWLP